MSEEDVDAKRMSFNLDILKDPLTDILHKYGFEENPYLPVVEQETNIQLKNIINTIKDFFLSLFKRKDVV